MGLPRAVIEANERADALMAQRSQQGTPQVAAPEAAPQAAQQQASAAPAATQVATPPAAPAAAPTQTPASTPAFESTWEQRFKVLDGKYRAEVPRLHTEIKDLKSTVTSLQEQLANAAKQAPAPRVEFTAEEREQFGDELLNVVARVAAAQAPAAPAAAQVDLTPMTDRMQKLERYVAETAEDAFFRKLGEQVPHWNAQNEDAGFVKWLAEVDGFTGRVRQDLFNEAYDALDVGRIANFFKAFPYQSPVARTESAVPSLESQVAPDVSRAAPPVPPGQKIWTRAEIQQHYDQVRRGVFEKNPDDAARIEQDIFAAQREKRIR